MESSKPTADCMSCHRELNMDFISQVTPKIFYAFDYSKKRAEDFLSQERSLLLDTQHLVEGQKQRVKRNEQIAELNNSLSNLRVYVDRQLMKIKQKFTVKSSLYHRHYSSYI
jgi:hypothetical protein